MTFADELKIAWMVIWRLTLPVVVGYALVSLLGGIK
jgi:hypothetical protein